MTINPKKKKFRPHSFMKLMIRYESETRVHHSKNTSSSLKYWCYSFLKVDTGNSCAGREAKNTEYFRSLLQLCDSRNLHYSIQYANSSKQPVKKLTPTWRAITNHSGRLTATKQTLYVPNNTYALSHMGDSWAGIMRLCCGVMETRHLSNSKPSHSPPVTCQPLCILIFLGVGLKQRCCELQVWILIDSERKENAATTTTKGVLKSLLHCCRHAINMGHLILLEYFHFHNTKAQEANRFFWFLKFDYLKIHIFSLRFFLLLLFMSFIIE